MPKRKIISTAPLNNKGIGIFDSGIGGLTVVKEIVRKMPSEKIIYLGDTAHTPYGSKTKETIIKFSRENIKFLITKNIKLVIIACNTASALALENVKKHFDIEILGVIDAGAKAAVSVTKNGRVGVIGTLATIKSGAYPKAIKEYDKDIKVFTQATPLLVPLVEEGRFNSPETELILKKYLAGFKTKRVDTLVLGCTHYPLLKKNIMKLLPGVKVIDSAEEIAKDTANFLEARGMGAVLYNKGESAFYVTDDPERFNKVGRTFLKKEMIPAKLVKF